MKRKALIGLMGVYGFNILFEKPEEHKTRFQGYTTFIDVWQSPKKGTTLGIYDPKTGSMQYMRKADEYSLEEVLIRLSTDDNK